MLKNSVIVTFFLILSSLLGFIAQIVFARFFGTSAFMDIYFNILSLPSIITGLVPVVFTSVLLPNFTKFGANEKSLNDYISTLWTYVIIFSVFFSVLGCAFTIYRIFFIYNLSEILKVTAIKVSLFVWLSSGIFIVSSFFSSILNYNKQFIKVVWVSILPPVFTILFVLLFHNFLGVISIALGTLVAILIQFIIFFSECTSKYSLNILLIKRIFNFKEFFYQISFVFFSLLPFTSFSPISFHIASKLVEGSVSSIGYAQNFSGFLSVATSMGASIVSYPSLLNDYENGDIDNSLFKFEITLKYILLFSIFFASAFISVRIPIINLLYNSGRFTDESFLNLVNIIPWYLISAIFIAGLNLLRTLFYTMGRFKSNAMLGFFGAFFFYFLAVLLKEILFIEGIAIANTISFFLLFLVSVLLLKSKKSNFLTTKFWLFLISNIISAVISTLVVFYLSLFIYEIFSSIVVSVICLTVFTIIFYLLSKFVFKSIEIIEIEKVIINQIKLKLNL
jgi:putative peptidoglycan lipid II flippase